MRTVKVTHGRGPVTAIVGRGQTVEVQWDDGIEQMVDDGRLVLVGKRPAKKKAEQEEEVAEDTPEGFTGAIVDTGDFVSDADLELGD